MERSPLLNEQPQDFKADVLVFQAHLPGEAFENWMLRCAVVCRV